MKTLTGVIAVIALIVSSAGPISASQIDVSNLASLKNSMSTTEIEAQLTACYNTELSNLHSIAKAKSDHIPEFVRKQQAKQELDNEYAQIRAELSL
ncbi:MAG: hypothetical protein QNK26_14160 [Moritella sp.]|uniref:hypothetical protein n=1 Tax=Moritella sp. TaxID=78556 RepID=UPI0029A0F632|nr:hypothetical protein [Moritella sp.]MDX2321727.1 hypothetical protein [Moritella sp.]